MGATLMNLGVQRPVAVHEGGPRMSFAGRPEELRVLKGLFVRCTQADGSVAVVSGGVAIGKSALLLSIADWAAGLGAIVLVATCSRMETGLPLAVVNQLFQSARLSPERKKRVAQLLSEGARAETLADSDSDSDSDPGVANRLLALVTRELHTVLVEIAERRPLLVGIDDVHHADPLSRRFLLYLAGRLRSSRVLMVINDREGMQRADPSFHAELLSHPHCRRIRLRPLSPRGVTNVLAEQLDSTAAGRLAPGYHAASGGNPLLVRALLEDHHNSPTVAPENDTELVVEDAFGEAVVNCLHRGGANTVKVARGLAVLGDVGSSSRLGRLLGLPVASVTQVMHALSIAGLLRSGTFPHQAARAAVLNSIDAADRADLHYRAARMLFEEGAAAMEIVEHVIAARQTAEAWMLSVLRTAAEQALADDRVGLAVQCLELACDSCRDELKLAEIRALLALVESRVDPTKAFRHLPELTAALRAGHLRGRHAIVPIRFLLLQGRLDEARCLLRELGKGATDAADSFELSTIREWLACSYPQLLETDGSALAEPVTDGILPATASQEIRAASALAAILTHGGSDDTIGGAEQVLESFRLDDVAFEPVEQALLALVYAGQVDRSASWCDLLLQETADRRIPGLRAVLAAVRAEIAIRQGDLSGAEYHAHVALAQMPSQSWGGAVGLPLASLLLARTEMGKFDEAADQLSRPVPAVVFETRFGLHYLHARGHYYLATRRPRAAFGDFLACGELMSAWRLDLPALVPWRSDAAQAYLQIGNGGRARDLIEEQLGRPDAECPRIRGLSLRVLAATREPRQRPAILTEAVELLQVSGDQLELARTLTDLSHVYQELGDDNRARMTVHRATHLARGCGAEPMLHRALRFDRAVVCEQPASDVAPSAVSGSGMLSDAERRVAALAAVGNTNREIAGKLFITVSTVEQHLTSTYRKLNVSRRIDLPTALRSLTVGGMSLAG
jgi:DNA-binding CsgD family transcriptional regulator